jgi:hypothetical protein
MGNAKIRESKVFVLFYFLMFLLERMIFPDMEKGNMLG